MPVRSKSTNRKISSTKKNQPNVKSRSWTATQEQRAVMAALEWDSLYSEESSTLEDLGIDREAYLAMAMRIRIEPGFSLKRFILERVIFVTNNPELVALQMLVPVMGPDKALSYIFSFPDGTDRAKETQELIHQGHIKECVLGDGRFCFYMPFPQNHELSDQDVRAWHASLVQHYLNNLSGLSTLLRVIS